MGNNTVQKKMSVDQFRDFARAVLGSLPDELDDDTTQGWIDNQEALHKALREALLPPDRGELIGQVVKSVHLVVNYNDGISEHMLKQYGQINANITCLNFPTKRKGSMSVVMDLIMFNRSVSYHEVLRGLDGMYRRPVELLEFLTWDKCNSYSHQDFHVVAPVVWRHPNGDYLVPYFPIVPSSMKPNLDLYWTRYDFDESYLFAAVSK